MTRLPARTQQLPRGAAIERHRHVDGYVAVVLAGSYLEAGECGRRMLGPGDVAVHADFAAHHNRVSDGGALVLNLARIALAESYGRVPDPDALARLAQSNMDDASALLQRVFEPTPPQRLDWPDALHADLAADLSLSLTEWARAHRLAAETLSRGFRAAYGVTPKRMRLEMRARRALQAAAASVEPFAQVALHTGFSDQAQMTRAISAISGRPPGFWRRASIADKTETGAGARVR